MGFYTYLYYVIIKKLKIKVMAIKQKVKNSAIEVDLTGPQGNAFYLIGLAQNLSKQLGFNSKEIVNEMMSGDYENLIRVFDSNFGSIVTLYR
jgi:hypothetical protein